MKSVLSSVSIQPGATALQRTPSGPWSTATARVSPCSPAFEAQVGGMARVRSEPLDRSDIDDRAAAFQVRQGVLDEEERRGQVQGQCPLPGFEVHLLDGRLPPIRPALLTSTSSRPARGDAAGDRMPWRRRVHKVRLRWSRSLRRARRWAVMTRAPSSARRRAQASPMPLRPPGHQGDLAVEAAHMTGFPPFTSTSAPHM